LSKNNEHSGKRAILGTYLRFFTLATDCMPRSYTSIQDLLLQSDQVEAYKAIGLDLIHSFDEFDVATNSMMPRMVEAHFSKVK